MSGVRNDARRGALNGDLNGAMARARRTVLALAACLAVLLPSLPRVSSAQSVLGVQRAFPHARHAKLFPTCAGCHAGMQTGDARAVMPPPALCAECHNGTDARRVSYAAPAAGHDFLRFAHADHAARSGEEGRNCATCHGARAGAPRMEVARATPESCLGCHTHRAREHLAPDNRCATCHVSLTQSKTLTAAHIAAFPKPPTHAAPDFVIDHAVERDADVARCATCHARESCARCHVNASDVPAIVKLLPDARVAALLRGRAPTYGIPADHRGAAWENTHGEAAEANTRRCAACHARPSCTLCHTGALGQGVIRRLPDGRGGAPGVQLVLPRRISMAGAPHRTAHVAVTGGDGKEAVVPQALRSDTGGQRVADTTRTLVRPHPVGFERSHGIQASAGRMTCEGCHTRRFCSDCHSGESRRRFHPANFVARHAPESYGRDQQCQACHNPEVFCRSCHQSSGLASRGERVGAFHNAQPQWLLQHGRAARQGLESCATCHKQRDCMQCHATTGWGVNPHGPNFDARRVDARAKVMCARCHIADPLRER